MKASRVITLLAKELAEIRRTPAIFAPTLAMSLVVLLPFLLAIGIPRFFGEALATDRDIQKGLATAVQFLPKLRVLEPEAAAQAMLFQQFLVMLVLVPVAGAMSLASYSVIGEKQARTLEPLLATPLTTTEFLLAKILGSAIPSCAIAVVTLAGYLGGIWWLARPGVLRVMVSPRTLLIVLVLGPMAALVALQLAVIVSSRVNDPRSAQQIGVLVIMPVAAVLVAQLTGVFWLTIPYVLLGAGALLLVWMLLLAVAVRLFNRESILTRWK